MPESVQRLLFYRGVILALARSVRGVSITPIPDFHRAFGQMIARARDTMTDEFPFLLKVEADRIFGTYEAASEMQLEGESDTLLRLHPSCFTFAIEKDEAEKELRRIPVDPQQFYDLAEVFLRDLREKRLIIPLIRS